MSRCHNTFQAGAKPGRGHPAGASAGRRLALAPGLSATGDRLQASPWRHRASFGLGGCFGFFFSLRGWSLEPLRGNIESLR